jgi:single-strand DNA-binding protein
MYHKILLVGNLGRDPEMRYTPNGQQVTSFSLATSDKWTGHDGQTQERTIWWRVTVWGKDAENANQILKKGSKVLVEGRMTPDPKTGNPRVFTRQDGSSGAAYEVTALKWINLTARGAGQASESGDAAASGIEDLAGGDEADIPF